MDVVKNCSICQKEVIIKEKNQWKNIPIEDKKVFCHKCHKAFMIENMISRKINKDELKLKKIKIKIARIQLDQNLLCSSGVDRYFRITQFTETGKWD